MTPPHTIHDHLKGPLALLAALAACFVLLCCDAQLGGLSGQDRAAQHDDAEKNSDGKDEDDVVWIKKLTSADTILVNDDLTGSQIAELDGLGRVKSRTQLYPYGLSRHDNSHTTNVYADSPRDRSVGLDHMGARFYAPNLGIWTSADQAILTKPEQYVTSEFAAANPYAYANLRPTIAADRDGQFWHLAVGAAAGALIGGSVEAARQYVSTGKVEDWGRVGSAASGGAVAGTLTAANPAVALGSMMGVGAASGAAGGVTTRLVESGGKSAGTLTDVAIDASVGAATAGMVKGGGTLLRKVVPKSALAPPGAKAPVGSVGQSTGRFNGGSETARGTLTASERNQLQGLADRFETEIHVVGSRAAGLGRNIESSLPVGKGPGTRSDIDLVIDGQVDIDTRGALSDAVRGVGAGAGKAISSRGFSSPPHIKFKPGGSE